MERQESQRKEIAKYLSNGNSITPIVALEKFGCFRLAAIIHRLKNDYGMPIKTEILQGEDNKRYASYYIPKEMP